MSHSGVRWSRSIVLWLGIITMAIGVVIARRSYSGYVFSVLLIAFGAGIIIVGLARSFRAFDSGKGTGIAVASSALAVALGATAAIAVPQVTANSALAENRQWTRHLPVGEIATAHGTLFISTPQGQFIGIDLVSGKTRFNVDTNPDAGQAGSPVTGLAQDGTHVALRTSPERTVVIVRRFDGKLAWQRTIKPGPDRFFVKPLAAQDSAVAIETCPPRNLNDVKPHECRVEGFGPAGAPTWSGTFGNVDQAADSSGESDLGAKPVVLAPGSHDEAIVLDLATGKKTYPADADASRRANEVVKRFRSPRVRLFTTTDSSTQRLGDHRVVVTGDTIRSTVGGHPEDTWTVPIGDRILAKAIPSAVLFLRDTATGPIVNDEKPEARRFEVRSMTTGKVGLRGLAPTGTVIPVDAHTALAIKGTAYTLYRAK